MRRGLGTKVRTWPFFLLMYSKSELCSARCYINCSAPRRMKQIACTVGILLRRGVGILGL